MEYHPTNVKRWLKNLVKYISKRDNKKVIQLLNQVPLTMRCDNDGDTLLHCTVKTGSPVITAYLIEAGCDVNAKNDFGKPPLETAIVYNDVKLAKMLLNAGAIHENTYFRDSCGPLHMAAHVSQTKMVEMLIKAGCDVKAVDTIGRTPLHAAATSPISRFEIFKMLVDAGADVNAKTLEKNTPLHSTHRCVEAFELLIKSGADIHAVNTLGMTPLHKGAMYGNFPVTKILIEAGCNVNAIDNFGSTGLHYAASWNSPDVVRLLLQNGARVDMYDSEDLDALCYSIKELGTNFRYQSLRWSFEVNALNDYDRAFEDCHPHEIYKQLAVIKLLLKAGANINRMSKMGLTPLNVSVTVVNHSRVTKYLLKKGANFDHEDPLVRRILKAPNNGSRIPQLLIRHTAMYDAQNRSDGPKNFCLKKQKKELQKIYANCRDELELMRSTKVYDCVTFFNLLVDKNIGPYARNELIVDAFMIQFECIPKLFPNYCDLIVERFTKERRRQEYIKRATRSFNKIFRLNGTSLPVIITDNVMRYLPKKDLRSLASA